MIEGGHGGNAQRQGEDDNKNERGKKLFRTTDFGSLSAYS